MHVLDASKSVVVCSSLLADNDQRNDFLEFVSEEYEEIRSDYYDSLKDKKYVSLSEARKNKFSIDWKNFKPVEPTFFGRKTLQNYDLRTLISYIDWKPFFDVWQLKGKYPNRGFPKIFNDASVGFEAKKIYEDANRLIQKFINEKSLTACATISFHKANSNGTDDILIYDENNKHIKTLHGLRQQALKDSSDTVYYCLSDFIAPVESNLVDYVGSFVVTIQGVEKICNDYEAKLDDFNIIMTKAIADRLAEAFAEHLHERVRKEFWGYNRDELLNSEDLHKIKYPVSKFFLIIQETLGFKHDILKK